MPSLSAIPDSIIKQLANAPPPVFFVRRRVRLYFQIRRSRKSTEGARDARGPGRTQVYASRRKRKCSDPRASTPRDIEACRSPLMPQVRQTQGVPRAVFVGLLRSAPGGLTVSGDPPYGGPPIHRSRPKRLHGTSDRAGDRRRWGPATRGDARPDAAAWTAGPWQAHLRCHVIPRPPLPASCPRC